MKELPRKQHSKTDTPELQHSKTDTPELMIDSKHLKDQQDIADAFSNYLMTINYL